MTVIPHPRFERILIVRLSSMGDVVHALPAATMLRSAFPHATIGWLIEERWAELLCTLSCPRAGGVSPQRPLVDHVHPVSLKAWRRSLFSPQTWERIAAGLSDLRAVHYQVAVDFQGAVRSAVLARWSGAPTIYGAMQPRENAASMWYTRTVLTRGQHVVEQACSLAEALINETSACEAASSKRLAIPPAMFPCDPIAEAAIDLRLHESGIHNFAMLNPGAGWGAKQWPAARYGEVAQALAQPKNGLRTILNFGPREESLAREAEVASAGSAVALSFSISELIAVTRRARLFIGGDTGPMHLAAALGVPVVALFGPTDPQRNGPFAMRGMVLRNPASRNSLSHRDAVDPGLLAITSDEVVAAARQILDRTSISPDGASHG
jgi:heptosyltransferase I